MISEFEVEGEGSGTVTISFEGPGGNRFAFEDIVRLTQILERVCQAPSTRVILLAGQGGDFCLGRDVDRGPALTRDTIPEIAGAVLGLYERIRDSEVPIIAMVNGRAFGFGCALAGTCHITLAAEDARFALPELKGGLPPTLAISALTAVVDARALISMVLCGEDRDASFATLAGLATEAQPAHLLDERAARIAEAISRAPRESVQAALAFMAPAKANGDSGSAAVQSLMSAAELPTNPTATH